VTSVVRFETAGGVCALPVQAVREVCPASGLKPLPGGHEGVAGMVERGGAPVTVLTPLGPAGDHLLIVEAGGHTFGLCVERVLGVSRMDERQLGPRPRGQAAGYVAGVIRTDSGLELLLEPGALWREVIPVEEA
jgi:chemotaxis signal transduction protein